MVSTPNAPDGLFERIEKEPEETCLYKRLFLDYTYGLDRIYTREEIEKAKASPSFEREYNLKYLGLIGNVFHTKDIDSAIEKGKKYNPDFTNVYSRKSLGIDPGFGSSPFGLVVTEWVDNQIQIAYAEEFERPDFNQMIKITLGLVTKYTIFACLYFGCHLYCTNSYRFKTASLSSLTSGLETIFWMQSQSLFHRKTTFSFLCIRIGPPRLISITCSEMRVQCTCDKNRPEY
jgi:hypothetical protein